MPREEFRGKIKEATKICPDKADIDYFALALKLNLPIWSNAKKLKEQSKVKIYSTEFKIFFERNTILIKP